MIDILTTEAIDLLKNLISKQSFSGEENETALLIMQWFSSHDIKFESDKHNVWAKNKYFDTSKKTILLNSHHDTVKPNKGYTRDPLKPEVIDGKLYGLGSNDAGGCLVSLLATFTYFYNKENLKYNFVIVASAEEENSGPNGLNSMLKIIPRIDFAIVGEPTLMQLAIAEKGLMVLNCEARGTAGHAAHGIGDNAIYNAIADINWFQNFEFPKVSETLGKVKMTVTQIEAGHQHNVIPASCKYVVDVRVTDSYSNQEVFDIINSNVTSEVCPRSIRLNSSFIPKNHPIVEAGIKLGRETYGSPTLSDQAVLSCPSLKLGPGQSLRSHTADEFIYIQEIKEGIDLYIKILNEII
ncbi:MAG: M20 family metallo-hydrolase [Lutibacter sp.]|uniref:M20 family metallo-hydrolase n=1 Tax=Lutibacter sp. TaxID=1925666 RepID=UPI0017C6ADD1|nr:M20 family metallo-hydrolase [Lutibacter sp.]MBT8316407.1 M20 family metallo-hydrolase [Lutibacter sp.]NNJ57267.1 M20 family metallo-hydrolase [Lutibacter sp.]